MTYIQISAFLAVIFFSPQLMAAEARLSSTENTGNPAISMIGNFTGNHIRGSDGSGSSSFLPLSETEIVFGANIDPHARLDVTITGAGGGMAVEEGFITSQLPNGLSAKSGRKFLPIGRVNGVHPHALVYADRPNGLVNVFGAEPWVGDGILLDKPFFAGDSIQMLTAGVFSTTNTVAFDPTGTAHYAGLVRWTGVWDTSDFSTLELGSTYAVGNNGIAATASQTKLLDAHLAWKHQDLNAFTVNIESEWVRKTQEQGVAKPKSVIDGSYVLLDVGINKNWRVFSRFDYSHQQALAAQAAATETAISVGGVWQISEFQKMTLQYKNMRHVLDQSAALYGVAAGANANALLFRWVVVIGPHGAHAY